MKRDDLIKQVINGNKARKLHHLMQTPPEDHRRVLSHGGNQSNAMNALALLCAWKKWQFLYYTKPIPDYLRQNPSGNLASALQTGMKVVETTQSHSEISRELSAISNDDPHECYVPMGGQSPLAAEGIKILAEEIREFIDEHKIKNLSVILSSGTGTTALYLAHYLPECTVLTVPCVGDGRYLQEQMKSLSPRLPRNLSIIESRQKYRFAHPYPGFLETWRELCDAGIEFDLLYDTKMWHIFKNEPALLPPGEVMVVHSGGTEGNPSQLARYRRAGV